MKRLLLVLLAAGGAALWWRRRSSGTADDTWSAPAPSSDVPSEPPKLGGDVDPDSGPAPLSSTSGVVFRARGLVLALETLLAAVFFLAVLAFAILMHRYVVAVSG